MPGVDQMNVRMGLVPGWNFPEQRVLSLPGQTVVRASAPVGLEWLVNRVGLSPTPDLLAIEVLDGAGATRGMVAYDDWCPGSCHMHLAIDGPVWGRALLQYAFRLPFQEWGKAAVLGVVPGHNKRSLTLSLRLGFREVYAVTDGWGTGVPLHILEMRKEDCRFLDARSTTAGTRTAG